MPTRMTDRLVHWAETAPERTFVAKRVNGGDWRKVSYAEALRAARSIAQALLDASALGRAAGRDPLRQRPRAPAARARRDARRRALCAGLARRTRWSRRTTASCKHIVGLLTPGLVFASGPAYRKAIAAAVPPRRRWCSAEGTLEGRATVPFADLLATTPTAAVDAAHAKVGPDTIAKFLFTSGSTKLPKAVINTQRMWCANQQMIRQCLPALARSRRCWSTGCRGTTPSAATTTSASRSTTAARSTSTTASRRRR